MQPERGDNKDDRAVQAQLDRTLPDVKFDGVGFSDVIDFLRDVNGANIFVNWKALEGAGIDKNAPGHRQPVQRQVLQGPATSSSTASAAATPSSATPSTTASSPSATSDDLAKNIVTRVYDIRDLIINIPDFTDAPDFDLNSTSNSQSQSRKAAAGSAAAAAAAAGGGDGLFGGSGAGTTARKPARPATELVDDITKLITETVASDSWKDTGGSVGAIQELQGQLIVTQTPENQPPLVNLLEQLRETKSHPGHRRNPLPHRPTQLPRRRRRRPRLPLQRSTATSPKSSRPIQINNDSSTYTLGPTTSVPGSIGKTATALTTVGHLPRRLPGQPPAPRHPGAASIDHRHRPAHHPV